MVARSASPSPSDKAPSDIEEKPPSHRSIPSARSKNLQSYLADRPPVSKPNDSPAAEPTAEFTLRSCLCLVGAFFATFMTVGMSNAFGVYQQYYFAHELRGQSNFDISWIGSVSTFMLFLFAAPAGILADKIGPTPLIGTGAVLELFSIFMTSLCKKYYQFMLAQGILQGFSFSLFTVVAASIPPMYFKKNRGIAQGITVAGSSLGGVIWPIVLDQTLNVHQLGFGPSVRILGYIVIPLSIVSVLTIKRPISKPVDGEKQDQKPAAPPKNFGVLRSRGAILLYIGLGFSYLGFFVPLFFVSSYGVSLGETESFSFYYVSLANAASLFGRVLPGIFADRSIGYFNALILSMISSGVVCFCWTAATNTAGVVFWILAYGFASGAIMSLQFVCAMSMVGPNMAGAAIGICMTACCLPALFGSPIAGELIKVSFTALSCYAGAVMIVGGLFIVAARMTKSRELFARV